MVASMVNRLGSWIAGDESTRNFNQDTAGSGFVSAADRYVVAEQYYDNTMFDIINRANSVGVGSRLGRNYGYGNGAYKARHGLYRNIRAIRNPMRRAIDWYPGKLYPGAMTPDGMALPDGTPCCLPFDSDTPEELRLVVAQAFAWGNFDALRWEFGVSLPMLGDQFGEVEIDWDRGKIYPKLIHPGYVVDAEWNGSGDLIMYRLEIPMNDPVTHQGYKWGKRVDRKWITTYRDNEPCGYDGQPAVIPNHWGFVPAAWCQFRNVGGQHGASLSDGVRGKIDELNNILSPIHDYIGKFVNQGVVISGTNRKDFEAANESRNAGKPTSERDNPESGKQSLNYFFTPKDVTFTKLIDNLGLGEADNHVDRMIKEIEADLPEATIDDQIRQFRTPPSGEALKQMFGNVEPRVFQAQGAADSFWMTLAQMCVSIGGELANSGAWGFGRDLTKAQQKFLPFGLASYTRGDLDMTWLPRPLFANSQAEKVAAATALEKLTTPTGMKAAGLSDEAIFGPLPDGQEEYPHIGLLAELNGVSQASTAPGSTLPGQQPPTDPGLAADPNSAAAFFQRHVPPAMRATGGNAG